MGLTVYPLLLIRFWYLEAPKNLFRFFMQLNWYVMNMFSIPLFVRTFFKPAKLEYRKGLIVFSILVGMFVKLILISIFMTFVVALLLIEIVFFVFFLAYPLLPFYIFLR